MTNKRTSVALAITACIINFYLAGLYGGFERGYDYTTALYKECVGMAFSGGTAYGSLAGYHTIISMLLTVFIPCRLLTTALLSQLSCCLLLALALIKTGIWCFALSHIGESYGDPIYVLLRETVILGAIAAGLLLVLSGLQVFTWRSGKP